MLNLCQLEELKLSCIGCCGHNFGRKKDVAADIDANTKSFRKSKDKKVWGCRKANKISMNGVCFNLIRNCILCLYFKLFAYSFNLLRYSLS